MTGENTNTTSTEQILSTNGFRTMVAWLAGKINTSFANIKADYNANIKADYNANIKKQTICSADEYLEMYNAGTLQEDMLYLVFNEDKETEE